MLPFLMKIKFQQESEIAVHKKHNVNLSFIIFAQLIAHGRKNLNEFQGIATIL